MCRAMETVFQMCFLLTLFSLHKQVFSSKCGNVNVSETLSQNEGSFLNITYLVNINDSLAYKNISRFFFDVCQDSKESTLCKYSWSERSQNFTVRNNNAVGDNTLCVAELRDFTSSMITWEIKISQLLNRSITVIYLEMENGQTVLLIPLDVKYPSKVTNLTLDGQEVKSIHLINEGQEVNVSCTFNRGNPPAVFNLLDKNGKCLATNVHKNGTEIDNKVDRNVKNTDSDEGLLKVSLSVTCQDDWPTVHCEGSGSERTRSVSLLVRCAPQFIDSPVTLVSSEFEKVQFNIKAHTTMFNECFLTPPPLQDTFIPKVNCNLSGEPPNLVLMLHPEGNITQGSWKITLGNEIGSANTTVNITEHSMSETTDQSVEEVDVLTIVLSCGGVLLAAVIAIVVIRIKIISKEHKKEVTSGPTDERRESNDTIEGATMIVNDLYGTRGGANHRSDVSHTISPLPLTASEVPARPPRAHHVRARDETSSTQSNSPHDHETYDQTYLSSADVRKNKKMKKKGLAEGAKGDIYVSVSAVRKEKKRAIKDSTTPVVETDNTTESAVCMKKPARQRDANGLIYGDLVFTTVSSPKAVVEHETKTEYATIAMTAFIPPPRDYKK